MADQKLSELTAVTSAASADTMYVVTEGLVSRKITVANLTKSVAGVYNVKNYGATGNGTTDDTTAISAAITAANAAGGGQVFFPAGTYLASNVPLTGVANIRLLGTGKGSILDNSGNNNSVFELTSSASNIVIDSLSFKGDFDTASTNLTYQGAVDVNNCKYITVSNCHFNNLCGDAITFGWGTTHVAVYGNVMDGGLGFVQMISEVSLGWCQNVEIFGNSITDTASSPKPVADGSAGTISGSDDLIDGWGICNVAIYGNTFNMQGASTTNTKCNHAILLAAAGSQYVCNNVSIYGNVIQGQNHDAHFVDSAAIAIDASQQHGAFRNISIVGNSIYNCRNGIWVWGNSYPITVTSNSVWDTSYDAIRTDGNHNVISGNVVDTVQHAAISIQGMGHNCTGNMIYNLLASARGIEVLVALNTIIANNSIQTGTASAVGISATGSCSQFLFNTMADIAGAAFQNQGASMHIIGNHYYNNGSDFTEWGTDTITTLDE